MRSRVFFAGLVVLLALAACGTEGGQLQAGKGGASAGSGGIASSSGGTVASGGIQGSGGANDCERAYG